MIIVMSIDYVSLFFSYVSWIPPRTPQPTRTAPRQGSRFKISRYKIFFTAYLVLFFFSCHNVPRLSRVSSSGFHHAICCRSTHWHGFAWHATTALACFPSADSITSSRCFRSTYVPSPRLTSPLSNWQPCATSTHSFHTCSRATN